MLAWMTALPRCCVICCRKPFVITYVSRPTITSRNLASILWEKDCGVVLFIRQSMDFRLFSQRHTLLNS